MIKITLSSLISVLVSRKIRFVIEEAVIEGDKLYRFVSSDVFPDNKQYIALTSGFNAISNDRLKHSSAVMLYYNKEEQGIVACCYHIHQLVKNIKQGIKDGNSGTNNNK